MQLIMPRLSSLFAWDIFVLSLQELHVVYIYKLGKCRTIYTSTKLSYINCYQQRTVQVYIGHAYYYLQYIHVRYIKCDISYKYHIYTGWYEHFLGDTVYHGYYCCGVEFYRAISFRTEQKENMLTNEPITTSAIHVYARPSWYRNVHYHKIQDIVSSIATSRHSNTPSTTRIGMWWFFTLLQPIQYSQRCKVFKLRILRYRE